MNLAAFIERHRLPAAFSDSVDAAFQPFAQWLETRIAERESDALVLGINGTQGTGKSTVADYLSEVLSTEYDRRVAILSIDDLYLTQAERLGLARDVHPLFATRGVPGTHDVNLGTAVIQQLKTLSAGESVALPRFDKSRDDRRPQDAWPEVWGPIDLVIFEGWCVGSIAADDDALIEPINVLEANDDPAGHWRRYVNRELHSTYRPLFELVDTLLLLQAPGFEAVSEWRLEQERKLRDNADQDAPAVMSDDEVQRFIQHFERMTRHNLEALPAIADAVITLNRQHQATALRFNTV